jgi:hypothetical protein
MDLTGPRRYEAERFQVRYRIKKNESKRRKKYKFTTMNNWLYFWLNSNVW